MGVFENFLHETPLLSWMVAVCIAVIIEFIYAYEKNHPLRGKILNVCNGVLVCLVVFVLQPVVLLLGLFAVQRLGAGFIDLRIFTHDDIASQIATFFLFLFLHDFFFYALHLALHKVPFLWHIHAVHHSEEHLNGTSELRQHWLEIPLQSIFISLPLMILFKLTPVTLLGANYLITIYALMTHANINLHFGKFTWLFTSPQYHRIHHSKLKKHWDKNFAQFFPILDILFGTYVAPTKGEFPPTGLASKERIESLGELFVWPFEKWAKRPSGKK